MSSWTASTDIDVDEQVQRLCAAERAAVCDLAGQPAFRVALIRTANRSAPVCADQSPHRDGWLVAADPAAGNHAGYYGQRLPAAAPYRSFVTWLAGRDRDAAHAAWGEVLAGFDTPTLVGPPGRSGLGRRGVASFRVSERDHPGAGRVGALAAHHRQHRAAGRVGAAVDVADRPA